MRCKYTACALHHSCMTLISFHHQRFTKTPMLKYNAGCIFVYVCGVVENQMSIDYKAIMAK